MAVRLVYFLLRGGFDLFLDVMVNWPDFYPLILLGLDLTLDHLRQLQMSLLASYSSKFCLKHSLSLLCFFLLLFITE